MRDRFESNVVLYICSTFFRTRFFYLSVVYFRNHFTEKLLEHLCLPYKDTG